MVSTTPVVSGATTPVVSTPGITTPVIRTGDYRSVLHRTSLLVMTFNLHVYVTMTATTIYYYSLSFEAFHWLRQECVGQYTHRGAALFSYIVINSYSR